MPIRSTKIPAGLDPRAPILACVGTAHHQVDSALEPAELPSPLDLMETAVRGAFSDSGDSDIANRLAGRIGMVAVPEGNWNYLDPGAEIARRVGVDSARSIRVDVGVPQHTPIAHALKLISDGSLDAALIVGGEAKASQSAMQRSGLTPHGMSPLDGVAARGSVTTRTLSGDLSFRDPDERWRPQGEIMAQAEIDAGMWSPVEHYACIEAALRHAEGHSVAESQDDVAELWWRFNQVAADNSDAAFGEHRSIEFLRSHGPGNRPLAFPYAKWHSTQWAVDQAAALILCSVEVAADLGISIDRWVFPRVALESSLSLSLSKREELHRWQAMGVLGMAAAEHLGHPLSDLERVELYSCFPSAVRVQQRELGLPLDTTPTITGGMAFAGGPFNNFSYQATAAMTHRLREEDNSSGLVTTVSGLLTKPALAVWSSEPGSLVVDDLAAAAKAETPTREVVAADGLGTAHGKIATYCATYAGDEVTSMFVIADLTDGRRWVGTSTDTDLLSVAESSELIGTDVAIEGRTCRS